VPRPTSATPCWATMIFYASLSKDGTEVSGARQFSIPPHATTTLPSLAQNLSGFGVGNIQDQIEARLVPARRDTQLHAMPPKRNADPDEANGVPSKQQRKEDPEDFSNAVKKRLQSSSRTGQACDRCKVRRLGRPSMETFFD
jgi:hypothetical protein